MASIPEQFHAQLLKMVRSLALIFPECEETKKSVEFIGAMEGNEPMQKMIVAMWHNEIKAHKKLVQKKDSKLFKKIKDVDMLKGLRLHKKWESKALSMKSRETLWKYIQTLSDMAAIEAGEVEPEVQRSAEAVERIQKKLGLSVSDDGKTGNIDIPKVTEFVTQSLTNPDGESFQDMMELAQVFGGMVGMKDLPAQMKEHYAAAAAQDSQQEDGGAAASQKKKQ